MEKALAIRAPFLFVYEEAIYFIQDKLKRIFKFFQKNIIIFIEKKWDRKNLNLQNIQRQYSGAAMAILHKMLNFNPNLIKKH